MDTDMDWISKELSPLTHFQKEVLSKTVSALEEERICYRDITDIFAWMQADIFSKEEIIEFIVKGGNAFLNHLIFSLIYTREWTEETKDVFHVQDLALRINASLSPQLYRYVWVYVSSEILPRRVQVLHRGKGWYVHPLDARDAALEGGIKPYTSFFSSGYTPVLLLESTCRCMVFIKEQERLHQFEVKCNCERVWERNLLTKYVNGEHEKETGYDEVDESGPNQGVREREEADEGYISDENGSSLSNRGEMSNSALIDGIKISRCGESEGCSSIFRYVIEHSGVHFSSKYSDIVSAYNNYLLS